MSQYLSVKRDYPDAILLFRLGDFYEMFYDDAKVASEILGNSPYLERPFERKIRCPCAAFPTTASSPTYQSFSEAERRWLSANRWATRKQTKGIVERKVVRVLTPGAVLDSENLESKSNNFLACVAEEENGLRSLLSATSQQESFGLLFSACPKIFSPSLRTSIRGRYSFRIQDSDTSLA